MSVGIPLSQANRERLLAASKVQTTEAAPATETESVTAIVFATLGEHYFQRAYSRCQCGFVYATPISTLSVQAHVATAVAAALAEAGQ